MDTKLPWKEHIQHLRKSCDRKLNIIRKLSNTNYGADTSILIALYKTLIRSRLDYGAVAYATANPTLLRSLDTIHHTALRLASGSFRTSPSISIMSDLGEVPLEYHRRLSIAKYYARSQAHEHLAPYLSLNNTRRIPSILHETVKKALNLLEIPVDYQTIASSSLPPAPPWYTPKISTDTTLQQLKHDKPLLRAQLQSKLESLKPSMVIFTDGSKLSTKVGCAATTDTEVLLRSPLPSLFSVLSAELQAIFYATEYASTTCNNSLVICTDSLAAISSLTAPPSRNQHPIAQCIIRFLRTASLSLHLLWIPSHSEIAGNEKADQAAKEAALWTPVNRSAIPQKDFTAEAERNLKKLWQTFWSEIPLTNKLRAHKPSTSRWSTTHSLSRREEILLRRLRIGHCSLTHSYLLTKSPRPECPRCSVPLSVFHILCECQLYNTARAQLDLSSHLSCLDGNPQIVAGTLTFCRNIGLLPI